MKSGIAPGRDNIHRVTQSSSLTKAQRKWFGYVCSSRRVSEDRNSRRHGAVLLSWPFQNQINLRKTPSHTDPSHCSASRSTVSRLIHSRIDPVVDPQRPREQAGFRRGRSTVDQVTLLTQYIEDSFQHNEKAGIVFLDLTAAYDTVWHRGLHLKLLRIIPDRHMVGFIFYGDVVKPELRSAHQRRTARSRLRRMKSRRVPSSHRSCLTSIQGAHLYTHNHTFLASEFKKPRHKINILHITSQPTKLMYGCCI